MWNHLRRLGRDERGMTFVFVGLSFVAFLAATTLAIDVGMFMTARSQAQNSADAGALAGATALAVDSFTDHTASGPAVQSAVTTALANQVIAHNVSIGPGDVQFLNGPSGLQNRVKVTVYRTAARSNSLPTLMGQLFGVSQVDVLATATAEASPANAEKCVKPFTIPDKWIEKQDPGGWTVNSTFDMYDNKGNLLANPDIYIGPNDPTNYTGYNAVRDRGLELTLKANNSTNITSSFYNPYDITGSVGANDYRNNIAGCNTALLHPGDTLPPENGNMVGPTKQGMDALVAQDPGAYWDTACNCVQGSSYPEGRSPRITIIPVYDPIAFANGAQHGKNITLTFTNFIGFFLEPLTGAGEVKGRITPVAGLMDSNAGPAPASAFPYVIRLVQ
jgi:Flp pilus assembly protein TadG